ncbi:hypothetical protein P4L29_22840 [Bacillus cereus]|nr:hypothetical protein [Bacillus cereus]
MSEKNEVVQPISSVEIDPTSGKKIMPNDKRGLGGEFATIDHEGNIKIPPMYLERAGITLPPNDEWVTEVELGGSDQLMRISTTQMRCENCRANFKTHDYYGRYLCTRCRDEAEFKRRLELRQLHNKWLLIFELTTDFDSYQEYIATRNILPPWVREQELLDKEIKLGRILTQTELNEFVAKWKEDDNA